MVKNLLIIEEDENCVEWLTSLLIKNSLTGNIHVRASDQQGIDYFIAEVTSQGGAAPELVFLGLSTPFKKEWVFLDWFSPRSRQYFPNTGICILSDSDDPDFRKRAMSYSCVIDIVKKTMTSRQLSFLKRFHAHRQQLYTQTVSKE